MSFNVEVVTPAGVVASGEYSEVVLPAFDGESGVLDEHQDFIGSLGTGALKLVRDNQDHWLVISGGVYRIQDGKLTILPQLAEAPDEIDIEVVQSRTKQLEKDMVKKSALASSFTGTRKELELCKARSTVYKRAKQVN